MMPTPFQSCIDTCYECAQACDMCAAACLAEPDPKMMARCIALDDECAAMCRLAAQLMGRASEHASELCQLCAAICDACAGECSHHEARHCQDCAAICRRCAEECRRMRAMGTAPGAQQAASATAH